MVHGGIPLHPKMPTAAQRAAHGPPPKWLRGQTRVQHEFPHQHMYLMTKLIWGKNKHFLFLYMSVEVGLSTELFHLMLLFHSSYWLFQLPQYPVSPGFVFVFLPSVCHDMSVPNDPMCFFSELTISIILSPMLFFLLLYKKQIHKDLQGYFPISFLLLLNSFPFLTASVASHLFFLPSLLTIHKSTYHYLFPSL